jgi:hypothetical protein
MQFHEYHGPAVGRELVSKFKPQITQIVTDDRTVGTCGFSLVASYLCPSVVANPSAGLNHRSHRLSQMTGPLGLVASDLCLLICVHL